MLRKIVAVVAVAALAWGAVSCSSEDGANSALVTAHGSEPQNPLVPANTNETGGGHIIDLLFSGLVSYNPEGEIQNEVAESIDKIDDTTYKVRLGDHEFSDGTPVTSSSFVDAWNYAVENSLLSAYFFEPIKGYKEGASTMEGLKVEDEHTFTIELAQPEADFPTRLGYSAFYPLPAQAFEDIEAFGQAPIGNGPYVLESWNHNQDATLVPNDSYTGPRQARNEGIQFVFYAQLDAAYSDLLSGNLDVMESVPESALATFEEELGDRAVTQPAAAAQSVTIPTYLEHFSGDEGELRRQAISMAINREELLEQIFHGTREPATEFSSPVLPGYNPAIEGNEVLTFNPQRARELWKQADAISPYEDTFTISYNADGDHQSWVDAVCNQLSNTLGIEAVGDPTPDFKSLRDRVVNKEMTGAFRTGWQADYPSVGNFLGPQYATGGGSNDGGYSNPDFDEALSRAASAPDAMAAQQDYNEAQKILLKDLPAIPAWYTAVSGAHSEHVDNVRFAWNSAPVYYQITKTKN